MSLPTDHETLCRWRAFIIQRWVLDHDIDHACVQALCLGMPMSRDDFIAVIKDYVTLSSENGTYGKTRSKE
jgi:hypothetical protein